MQQHPLPPRRRKLLQEAPIDDSMSMLMDLTLPSQPNPPPQSRPLHQLANRNPPTDDSIAFNQLNEDELAELAFKEEEERERKRKERREFLKDRELEKSKQKDIGKENQGNDQLQTQSVSNGKEKVGGLEKSGELDGMAKVESLSSSPQSKSPSKNKLRRRRDEFGDTNQVEVGWGSKSAQLLAPSNVKPFGSEKAKLEKMNREEVVEKVAEPVVSTSNSGISSIKFQEPAYQKEKVIQDSISGQEKVEETVTQNNNKSKLPSRLPRKSFFVSSAKESVLKSANEVKVEDTITVSKPSSSSSAQTKIPSSTTSPTKPSFKPRTTSTSNKISLNKDAKVDLDAKSVIEKEEKAPKMVRKVESIEKQEVQTPIPAPIFTSTSNDSQDELTPSLPKPVNPASIDLRPAAQIVSKKEAKSSTPSMPNQTDSQTASSSKPLPLPSTSTSTRSISSSAVSSSAEVPVGFRKTSTGALVVDPHSSIKPFSFSASLPTSSKPIKSNNTESKKPGAYKANQVPEWIKLRKQKLEIEREFKLKNQVELIRKGCKDPSKEQIKKDTLSSSTHQRPLVKTKVQAFKLAGEQRSLERKEFERVRDENQRILEQAREEARLENERKKEEEMKKERERTIIRANEIPASSRRVVAKK